MPKVWLLNHFVQLPFSLGQLLGKFLGGFLILLNCHPGRGQRGVRLCDRDAGDGDLADQAVEGDIILFITLVTIIYY